MDSKTAGLSGQGATRRRHFRATPYERIVKPSIDRGLSAVLFVVLSPLLFLISLAILVDSGRPIFFVQRRVGQYGSRFDVIRFRTLSTGSALWSRSLRLEPVTVPVGGADLTMVGQFLLGSRMDRLPMLVNVLRGQMSLVGPRPALPYELEHYGPVDWLRLRIKPGVACLWQLSGLPEDDFRAAMAMDQEYVNDISPALDIQILWRTVRAVAGGKARH